MKKERKKHPKLRLAMLSIFGLIVIAAIVFTHFGGFSTGESADPAVFATYAGTIADISIPDNVTVIALGEATHGNAEFQELKLTVFRHLVESCGVRAFALEGDFGGCEQVNRYIHGGEGSAQEAAAAIGFALYRTDEMAELIDYMREYNDTAPDGEDLRFYGFDMQRCAYNIQFLTDACKELGIDTFALEALVTDNDWSGEYDTAGRKAVITAVKAELEAKGGSAKAIHHADILLQNCELQGDEGNGDYAMLRDRFMTDNTLWIAQQEKDAGFERIFVSAHNGHVARWGSFDQMGKLLADELGDNYYAIGTDFYKTSCNLPRGSSGDRTVKTFYSHDPLAKAAKRAGLDVCWLDFSKIPENTELSAWCTNYVYMGSLGEGYSLLNRLLPPSYRIFQPPAQLYSGMIFVANATPTEILDN